MKSYSSACITSIAIILIFCFSLTPCFSQREEMEELKLSLHESIELALENNLDIAARRIDPEISQLNYEIAKAIFDPELSAGALKTFAKAEASTTIEAEKSESNSYDLSMSGLIATGGRYSASLNASRYFRTYPPETSFTFAIYNPVYDAGLNFTFDQPLLRNFGREVTRYTIILSKNNYNISYSQFRQTVIATMEEVEKAYWNLVGAIDQLKVQKESLKLAEDHLEQIKIMVKVGTRAPIDITEAEATVAERIVYVINAENAVKAAEDTLRKILNIAPDSPLWGAAIRPIERPYFEKISVNLEETIETALRERPEIEESKLNLKNLELTMRYQRNQRLPNLDLHATYSLSGLSGKADYRLPGPDNLYNTPDDIIVVIDEDIADAFEDIKDRNFYNWSLGLNFGIPIRNRTAIKNYIISKLEYDKANINYRSLENSIAIEVKEVVRNIEMSLRRLDATKASRILSKERLNAIQKKFENGMATSFEVSEYQQALAAAESEEINALIEYNIALLSLEKARGSLLQSKGIVLESESEI